jgi:hypothetical protein
MPNAEPGSALSYPPSPNRDPSSQSSALPQYQLGMPCASFGLCHNEPLLKLSHQSPWELYTAPLLCMPFVPEQCLCSMPIPATPAPSSLYIGCPQFPFCVPTFACPPFLAYPHLCVSSLELYNSPVSLFYLPHSIIKYLNLLSAKIRQLSRKVSENPKFWVVSF